KRHDIQLFERHLEDNLFALHKTLANKTYRHGTYQSFYVQDPKQRHIHKATVVDRVVHHLLYNYLYELFDKTFIFDSFSCRLNKGTHKGVNRLEVFTKRASSNYTRPSWVLKCDIKEFFASVDHKILLHLIKQKVKAKDILWLLNQVIKSFHSEKGRDKGMPLGNLTSQIFSNIYLNELDQFVKHTLKFRCYLRYADDFLLLSSSKDGLVQQVWKLRAFLQHKLRLKLHPQKIIIRPFHWGIDFLGYVVLPYCRLPRTKTKRRMFKKLQEKVHEDSFKQSYQSYLGYLKHANSYKIQQQLRNTTWFLK
ncbi:group II intron reverse transcriptase domain-containing protein, partial [Candidatus Roizmanbacteria bacterium]|nr:group II intron reverse transcriptase domain-containing protein [Candidatus Roizmanbacteria bacterium]